jgi:replicative DNA helicase
MMAPEIEFVNGLPQAVDVEKLVLGSALLDASGNMPVILGQCREDCFSVASHQLLFRRLCGMLAEERAIDRITLYEELKRRGEVDLVNGLSGLMALDEGLPTVYNLDAYCEILVEKAALRRAITTFHAQQSILSSRGAGMADIAAAKAAIANMDADQDRSKTGFQNMAELIMNVDGGGPEAYLVPTPQAIGMPWPWDAMTAAIGGMRPGQVVTVSAGTSVGKTNFGCNAVSHVASLGHTAAILTAEMSAQEQVLKILCQRAGVSLHRWMRGESTNEDRRAVIAVIGSPVPGKIHIDERESVTPGMLDLALAAMREDPPAVVMVDYFQLMESGLRSGDANREQHLAHVSRQIKRLARKYKTCFLVLSQVNDSGSTRESKALENDSTVVILLERELGGATKLKFRKSRFSARSEMYLGFDGTSGNFFEVGNEN